MGGATQRDDEVVRRGRRTEAARHREQLAREARRQAHNRFRGSGPQLQDPREFLVPGTHCDRCGKVACATEEIAKETKRGVEHRSKRTNEVRYYQCYPDGPWHWTRLDATLDGWKRRRRR